MSADTPPVPLIDERKAERIALALPVAYALEHPSGRVVGDTETTNLSGGGVQFLIPKKVKAPTPCHVFLTVPEQSEALSFAGFVSWCRPVQGHSVEGFEVGVAFAQGGCDAETFERYCHFIAAQLLLKYLQ